MLKILSITIGVRKKMSDLGKRLSEEVERVGGVSAVSTSLKTARNTIYNWIEKENIPANKLLELGGMGVNVLYVLTGERSAQSVSGVHLSAATVAAITERAATEDEAQILAWLRGLNEAARTGLMLFVANAGASPKKTLIGQQFNGAVGQAVQGDIYNGPRRRRDD